MPNLQRIRLVPDEGLGYFFNVFSLLALKLLLFKELCYNIHAQELKKRQSEKTYITNIRLLVPLAYSPTEP